MRNKEGSIMDNVIDFTVILNDSCTRLSAMIRHCTIDSSKRQSIFVPKGKTLYIVRRELAIEERRIYK